MLLPRRGVGLALSGIATLGGVAVDGLAVGSDHTCVVLDDGSVKVSKGMRSGNLPSLPPVGSEARARENGTYTQKQFGGSHCSDSRDVLL